MKDDQFYVRHIIDSIENIESYVTTKEEFFQTKLIQDAVIRNLEIICEATKNISKQYWENYQDIPWWEMARLRDVLIHHYFSVDLKIVWGVVEKELPKIIDSLKRIE